MITILDLDAEFAKLNTLEKRSATTTDAEHLTVDVEDSRTLVAAQLTGSTKRSGADVF
jgi:hypothetical protein